MPAGYQRRSVRSNCTPSTSRDSRLRVDSSAGIPVSWKHSTAQHHAQAIPAVARGDVRGHRKSTPTYAIDA
jgi:hypothetical protein